MRLTFAVRLAARNMARHRVRTALTIGMVVAGVGLLEVGLSWARGSIGGILETATGMGGHVRVVAQQYAEREELMPLYENLPDTVALEALLGAQPGVTSVEPRIISGVTVTVGEEIGDVFALAVGANERYFRERLDGPNHLAGGHWFTGAPDELIAGAKVVSQTHAKVGDELVLLGLTQDGSMSPIKGKLIGILKSGNAVGDQQVLVPLEKMRWLADIPHGATELLIFGSRYTDGPPLAKQLRTLPELKSYAVQAWSDREPWRSLLSTLRGIQSVIIFAIVLLTALGIWNTLMMSVLERTHEIGVLRAMGLSRGGAVSLFVIEALSLATVGGIAGVILGAGPAYWLQTHGLRLGEKTAANLAIPASEVIRGELTWGIALTGFALGLLMAVLGSVLPALRAATIQPVSAMRSGR